MSSGWIKVSPLLSLSGSDFIWETMCGQPAGANTSILTRREHLYWQIKTESWKNIHQPQNKLSVILSWDCESCLTETRQCCNNKFLQVSGFIGSAAKNGSCPLVCISVMPEYCDHREIKFLPRLPPLEVFNLTIRVVKWNWATISLSLSLVTPRDHYQLLVLVYPEEAV